MLNLNTFEHSLVYGLPLEPHLDYWATRLQCLYNFLHRNGLQLSIESVCSRALSTQILSTKGKSGTCLIPFERTGSSPVFLKGRRRVPPARTRMSLFSLGLNHINEPNTIGQVMSLFLFFQVLQHSASQRELMVWAFCSQLLFLQD